MVHRRQDAPPENIAGRWRQLKVCPCCHCCCMQMQVRNCENLPPIAANHLVYCLISPNGRRYVGQTPSMQHRLKHHSRQPPRQMAHDLRLYGNIQRFRVEILAAGLTNVQADDTEEDYIKVFKARAQQATTICPVALGGPDCSGGGWGGKQSEMNGKADDGSQVTSKQRADVAVDWKSGNCTGGP